HTWLRFGEIMRGSLSDKRHFFLSKIVQLKVRQKDRNSLEIKNHLSINLTLNNQYHIIICMIF
ncbi:hypothetical protein, partial [Citrobacter freundii]|uniref:hypothetical protein n=1 Tax=Citrobacter freundii TaxID=546 RepID=UPI0023AF63A8